MSSAHNHIRAVLFDLDGTLRYNQPDGFQTFTHYLTELGYRLSLAQLQRAERWNHYYWATSLHLRADIAELGADTPAFWTRHAERLLTELGVDGEDGLAHQLHQLMEVRYRPLNVIPEDALPTLTRLRSLRYVVGLVSNRSEPLDAVVAELGFDGLFDFTLSAGEARSWKPDPAIFLEAVARAGCAPAAAVYVGDNFYADVEGARNAGLRPVLIDPRGLFPDPRCPVIRALSEVEGVLARVGTNPKVGASVA
jgi:HAD superfamily hydrolase (TIGR01509 family)